MKNYQRYATIDPKYVVDVDRLRAERRKQRAGVRLTDLYRVMLERDEVHRDCEERLILELSVTEQALWEAQKEPMNQQRLGHLERVVAGLKKDVRMERYSFWRDMWDAKKLLWSLREEV